MIPQHDLHGARRAHARLLETLDGLTDEDARRASNLDGWSVGHVLTHLARNADAATGMFHAAAEGRVGDQYPGGVEQRAADIDAGASRPAAELAADVREANARLEAAWAGATDSDWANGQGRLTIAGLMPLSDLVFRRWREVEVHHADLGLDGFTWHDWSDAYVDLELDRTTNALAPRLPDAISVRLDPTDAIGCWIVETVPQERVAIVAPRHELLAWLLGRHDRPDWPALAPW